jgi:hypothetical protein
VSKGATTDETEATRKDHAKGSKKQKREDDSKKSDSKTPKKSDDSEAKPSETPKGAEKTENDKSKTKEGKSSEKKKKAKTETELSKKDAPKAAFLPAKKYEGSKSGYVFKRGAQGVGYYLDVKPVVDKMAMEAIVRLAAQKNSNSRQKKPNKRRGRH